MARRSFAGGVGQFFQGFNQSYDTIGRVLQDYELAKVASAKPEQSQGYTADDGQQLEAIAAARDAQGNPYYTLGADAQGNYTVTPTFNAADGTPAPAATVARRGVTDFMGQRVAGSMTDDQVGRAKLSAVADVLMKTDPAAAIRMKHELSREARADKVFDRQEKEWARADEDRAKVADYETARQQAFDNSIFGQKQVDYAKRLQQWRDAVKAHTDAGGTPDTAPAQPSRPAYSLAESLADRATMLATDAQHGKLDTRAFAEFSDQMRKAEDEGYAAALRMAASGAPIEQVVAKFNEAGAVKLDPKAIVSDEVVKRPDGVPTRVIKMRDASGNVQTIDAVASLDALGKAQDVFTRFFASEQNRRGNEQIELSRATGERDAQRVDIARGHLGVAQANSARAARKDAQDAADKKATADAVVARYVEANPNATKAQIEAARRGVLDPLSDAKNLSPQAKLARDLVTAGVAPDMASALERVMTKDGKTKDPKDLSNADLTSIINATKDAFGGPAKALHNTAVAEYNRRISGGDTAAAGGGKKAPPKQGGEAVYEPKTQAEFDKLPSGALYVDPEDKRQYRKP